MMNKDIFNTYPTDWKQMFFDEVFHTVTDYVANGSFATLKENVSYKDTQDYAVLIRVKDYTNNFKSNFVYVDQHAYNFLQKSKLKPDDIVISNVGAIGTVFKVPNLNVPMTLGPNAILLKTNQNNEFFYQYLKSSLGQKKLKSITSTTAQPKFNKTDFKSIICFAPPLKEQQKIAAILSSVDEAIEKTEQIIEQTEKVKKGLMQELLTKGIGHMGFKDSPLGEIPVDWKLIKFEEVIDFLTDYEANGSFSDLKENVTIYNEPNYAYYVRATDLEKEDYKSDVKYVDKNSYDFLKKTKLHGGELLFAKRGQIGKLYIMPNLDIKSTLAPNLYLIKINNKIADNKYYYYFFKSHIGQSLLHRYSASTTLGAIYKKDIKSIKMPLPPLEEQKKIVSVIESIDNKIEKENCSIKELTSIKQGLMQDLLTGKKRVKIDDSEEVLS